MTGTEAANVLNVMSDVANYLGAGKILNAHLDWTDGKPEIQTSIDVIRELNDIGREVTINRFDRGEVNGYCAEARVEVMGICIYAVITQDVMEELEGNHNLIKEEQQ